MPRAPLTGWRLAQIAPLATATAVDSLAGEARTGSTHGTTIEIRCQRSTPALSGSRGPGGDNPNIRETILVRQSDCADRSWAPQPGDQVVGFKTRYGAQLASSNLYVAAVRVVAASIVADAFWALDLSDDAPARRSA